LSGIGLHRHINLNLRLAPPAALIVVFKVAHSFGAQLVNGTRFYIS